MEGMGWCGFALVTGLFSVLYLKYQVLTAESGFPYPVPLLLMQSFLASASAWACYIFYPDSFPSMKKVLQSKQLFLFFKK